MQSVRDRAVWPSSMNKFWRLVFLLAVHTAPFRFFGLPILSKETTAFPLSFVYPPVLSSPPSISTLRPFFLPLYYASCG